MTISQYFITEKKENNLALNTTFVTLHLIYARGENHVRL